MRSRAETAQKELKRDVDGKHTLLNRELKQEAKNILEVTVKNPLSAISTFYIQKENKKRKGEYEDVDFKLEEQKIRDTFKSENIVSAFSDKEFRKDIVFNLKNFFDSEHNWQMYQNIERVDGYSNKEAKGFPVDVAKVVLEGINRAIEHEGVLNIEDDPSLFSLLNEVVDVYPDGLTHTVIENISQLMLERGVGLEMYKLARLPRLMNLI